MKKKTITLVVYMLVCISLVSVGFAAWIITGGEKETAQGNISATSVSDQSVSIEDLQWVEGLDTITFGHPTDTASTAGSGWLQHDAGAQEQLSAVCTFKVHSAGQLTTAVAALASTTLDVATVETATSVKDLQDNGYISSTAQIHYFVAATAEARNTVSADVNSTSWVAYEASTFKTALQLAGNDAYVAVKVTYSWGAKFGNVNPFNYFNEKADGAYVRKPLEKPSSASDIEQYTDQNNWKKCANDALTYLYTNLGEASGLQKVFNLNIKLLGEGEE